MHVGRLAGSRQTDRFKGRLGLGEIERDREETERQRDIETKRRRDRETQLALKILSKLPGSPTSII